MVEIEAIETKAVETEMVKTEAMTQGEVVEREDLSHLDQQKCCPTSQFCHHKLVIIPSPFGGPQACFFPHAIHPSSFFHLKATTLF